MPCLSYVLCVFRLLVHEADKVGKADYGNEQHGEEGQNYVLERRKENLPPYVVGEIQKRYDYVYEYGEHQPQHSVQSFESGRKRYGTLDRVLGVGIEIGKAEYVANLVAFLVADEAYWINGDDIIIDGGATLPNIFSKF